MLEISILVALSKYAKRTAEQKGHSGELFAVIAVVGWFGCGITGAVIGFLSDPMPFDGFSFSALIGYVIGVAVSALVVYLVVDGLHDKQEQQRGGREPELAAAFNADDAYERWRRRHTGQATADDDEPVELTPAGAAELPRARRVWRRKW